MKTSLHTTRKKSKPVGEAKAVETASPPKTVLVLRTCAADLTSSYGFVWPASGPVECSDWKPVAECGNGLHGWLWGAGDWSLKNKGEGVRWLVVEVVEADLVDIGGKVKFPRGNVVGNYGHWREAMAFIRACPEFPVALACP